MGDLELEEGHDRPLAFANAVFGRWRDAAGGLADGDEQVQGEPGPRAQLLERFAGQRGEAVVGGVVHERKRELTASQRVRQEVDRDAGSHGALDDAHAPYVSFTEMSRRVRLEDPQLDQFAQLIRADAGPFRRFGQFVRLHALYCSGGAAGAIPCRTQCVDRARRRGTRPATGYFAASSWSAYRSRDLATLAKGSMRASVHNSPQRRANAAASRRRSSMRTHAASWCGSR